MTVLDELHLVSPNDEVSVRNGSAVLRVASQLCKEAASAGQTSLIGCGRGMLRDSTQAVEVLVAPALRMQHTKIGRILDNVSKLILGRPAFLPHVTAGKITGIRNIFVHNQPWMGATLRRAFPDARIHLYVHNQIMTRATRSTIRNRLQEFDKVICVSEFIRKDLYSRSHLAVPIDDSNLVTVFNGVDSADFDIQGEAKPPVDVVYVGRIVPEKGAHVLAEALGSVARTRQIRVRFVGGRGFLPEAKASSYESSVWRSLGSYGINYEATGPVPPSQIPRLVNSATVWVIPSVWPDPCPLVLLEAMASKATPVATRVGGMPEVGGAAGVTFVDPGSPSQLASAISRLLDNPTDAAELSDTSREWASSRSWRHVYQELIGHI